MKFYYYLIINTNAGSGNGERIGKDIVCHFEETSTEFEVFHTHHAGEEVEIANILARDKQIIEWNPEKKVEKYPLLIVLGGDGTLHNVLNALDDYSPNIPVAYIPAGSGNDFSRGVGIDREDALNAFRQIQRAKEPQAIHVLNYKEKNTGVTGIAVNNYGIGIDAAVVHATNDSETKHFLNKYKMGSLAYVFSILKVLFTQKSFRVELTLKDGVQHEFSKGFLATTTNHPYFGGGVRIAPTADARGPVLDLILVEKHNWFILFRIIFLLFHGKHLSNKHVHHFQTDQLQLKTQNLQFAQIDGESVDAQEFDLDFSVRERLFWFE
ncbi:MAG: diacylglycerol kinase family lipid kinase [Streptococcaceae bacterium]|jgi:YegS/Rv2252/BmrU family lipid kinase|nr:diacylglycerol kinase family lipid kinase [Streptococcaceae bacterium]